MRILLITLNTKGGIVHYTSQLANSLSKNHQVHVIAPIGVETEVFNKTVNLIQLNTGNIISKFVINTILINRLINFLSVIKKINPDVIHLQSCHPWICLFLPFLSKNYKLITTIHDVNAHPGSRSFDQNIASTIHMKYSDALIVHGNLAKQKMEITVPSKKIRVIPHGDYSFFTDLNQSNYQEESNSVLFFGRIVAYKGLSYLIQAEPQVSKLIPNFKIVIAGSGDFNEKSYVEKSPNFELHNYFISNENVGMFFQRASAIVLPYIECTQTGIIPIAYSFKKPVIVTDVGSISEVVENNVTGYIIPARDPNAIADAVLKMLKCDVHRKQMGENAYGYMKTHLSWDLISEKTVDVYKSIR